LFFICKVCYLLLHLFLRFFLLTFFVSFLGVWFLCLLLLFTFIWFFLCVVFFLVWSFLLFLTPLFVCVPFIWLVWCDYEWQRFPLCKSVLTVWSLSWQRLRPRQHESGQCNVFVYCWIGNLYTCNCEHVKKIRQERLWRRQHHLQSGMVRVRNITLEV
jgi:hypothetical protein